jgi:hypothetical protein
MKKKYIPAVAILVLLFGCARPAPPNAPATAGASVEKCPIHNVAFSKGPGQLTDGMSVSWTKEVYAAMEKYPYVRRDTWESSTVKYCTLCDKEVENAVKSEKRTSQQEN